MADQLKNVMIGLFVTVATAIVIFMLMFLHPRIGDEGKILRVRFTDIDKITPGTRVTYAGKPVGEVLSVKEVEEGRMGRANAQGQIYLYELEMRVDSNTDVYNTDTISSRTSGLLGEKNVEITPMAPKKGQTLEKIDNFPIYANSSGSVEETFKEIKAVSSKVDKTLDNLIDIFMLIKDEKLIEKVTETIENIESIAKTFNNPKQIKTILTNVQKFTEKVLNSLNDADGVLDSLTKTFNHAQLMIENTSKGKGSLGKLLVDEEIYLRTNSIMSKFETTLDDINHYGLLFQSDKGWQRLRARRLNLLQELRTPQEFHNYFNDEIDQISTSLSRVFMVLNSVNEDPYCGCLTHNNEYNKVFAELMRRVDMLQEEVKMYNIQVVESRVHETELGSPPLCPSTCQNPCE